MIQLTFRNYIMKQLNESIINKGSMIGAGLGAASGLTVYLAKRRELIKQLDECPDQPCRNSITHQLSDLRADALKVGLAVGAPATMIGAAISNRTKPNAAKWVAGKSVDAVNGAIENTVNPDEGSGVTSLSKYGVGVVGGGLVGKGILDYKKFRDAEPTINREVITPATTEIKRDPRFPNDTSKKVKVKIPETKTQVPLPKPILRPALKASIETPRQIISALRSVLTRKP